MEEFDDPFLIVQAKYTSFLKTCQDVYFEGQGIEIYRFGGYNKLMEWLIPALVLTLLSLLVLILLFWQISNMLSALYGAPAVSSPHHDFLKSFANKQKTFLDLGCGNGSLCLRAAPHFKKVYGIEFSPFYYLIARLRASRYSNVTILYGDFLTKPWPKTDYIYCYLLPALLTKLGPKLKQSQATVLSYGFAIPNWKANKMLRSDSKNLFVY